MSKKTYKKCKGKIYKDYECLSEVAKKNPVRNLNETFKSIGKGTKGKGY